MKPTFLFVLVFLFFLTCSSKQRSDIDSLTKGLAEATHDTSVLNYQYEIGWYYLFRHPDTALTIADNCSKLAQSLNSDLGSYHLAKSLNIKGVYYHLQGELDNSKKAYLEAKEIFGKIGDTKWEANIISNLGINSYRRNAYQEALNFHTRAIELRETIGDSLGIATSLANISKINRELGQYDAALAANLKSLQLREFLEDERGVASSLNAVAILYKTMGEYEKSKEYFDRSYAANEKLNNATDMAANLSNLGSLASKTKDYKAALGYLKRSLALFTSLNQEADQGKTMSLIGNAFHFLHEYDSARVYYERTLLSYMKLGNKFDIGSIHQHLGDLACDLGDYREGLNQCHKAMEYAVEIEAIVRKRYACRCLVRNYEKLGDNENALRYLKEYTAYKDSMFNEDKSKEIGKLEAKYEFDKQEEEQRRLEEDKMRAEVAAKSRRDNLQYSGILIFLVAIFGGVFMLGKFSMPTQLVEGLVFFSFLLFFEFLLVLLDPTIEEFSSGAPAMKLMFNALLAVGIFPLHSLFEDKLKRRIAR